MIVFSATGKPLKLEAPAFPFMDGEAKASGDKEQSGRVRINLEPPELKSRASISTER